MPLQNWGAWLGALLPRRMPRPVFSVIVRAHLCVQASSEACTSRPFATQRGSALEFELPSRPVTPVISLVVGHLLLVVYFVLNYALTNVVHFIVSAFIVLFTNNLEKVIYSRRKLLFLVLFLQKVLNVALFLYLISKLDQITRV